MLKALAQELLSESLLARDDHVVVAVSGGPDSMALLHVLLGFNEQLAWHLRLHVAHLNHQLRGEESEQDAAFVQAAADSLNVPCTIESRDIRAMAAAESTGVEEVGRRERYAFFERVSLRTGTGRIALGHHADDNAETILHRILRGTGLRGLVGMPRRRSLNPTSDVEIIRPLLKRNKEWIRKYLADAGVASREDRTNLVNEPMRNRIRNVILPQIESEVNPQVREALLRLGEQAVWLEEFLRETVERTFETLIIYRTDQFLILNADALSRKSRIVATEIVRMAYRSFGLGEQDLGFAHVVSVLDLLQAPGSGKQSQLPGGMTVEKRYHELVFSLPTEQPRETLAPDIAVHCPGQTLLPIRRLAIECSAETVTAEEIERLRARHAGPTRLEEYLDFDAVHPPLVIRTRRPGDRFVPLGAPGSKKLSDFLSDRKVKVGERDRVAVLCDQLGPIWVIGHRIDDRVKLTALTRRVLRLRARPLEP